jgi:serine/threonine protein kinase
MLGKYRIARLIGSGGFAQVYAAHDTVEGIEVALKIPHARFLDEELLNMFRKEVRLVAKLEHPGIIGIKNASIIDGQFVVASLLGTESLGERLRRRISVVRSLHLIEQMIEGLAYAHESGLIHCDIKPENFILFGSERIRLTDFGIAKVATQTVEGSGSGTIGRMAPEQAMGRPTTRSDVFSLGLIMYRMLAGEWPEYPFFWPPPKAINLRRKHVHPDMIALIRKSISLRPRDRFADATRMYDAFSKIYAKTLRNLDRQR